MPVNFFITFDKIILGIIFQEYLKKKNFHLPPLSEHIGVLCLSLSHIQTYRQTTCVNDRNYGTVQAQSLEFAFK